MVGDREPTGQKPPEEEKPGGGTKKEEETRVSSKKSKPSGEEPPLSNKEKEELKEELREIRPEVSEEELNEVLQLLQGGRRFSSQEKEKIEQFKKAKTLEEAWEILDELLSDIYAGADMQPDEVFEHCFTFEDQIKLAELRRLARNSPFAQELVNKLSKIHSMRRLVHNMMMLIEGAHGGVSDVAKMMKVESSVVDTLFSQPGVATAYRLYEEVLERIRLRNKNWIPPELILRGWHQRGGSLDSEVRRLFIQAIKSGSVDGQVYTNEEDFKKAWPEWKINRALHLGRAFGPVSARFIEIVAQTRLPKGRKMISPYAEDFVRTFNPIESLVRKFGYGRELSFFYFLLSGEVRVFKNQEEIDEAFEHLTDITEVMKKSPEERHRISNLIWNLTTIDSRSSGWRLREASRYLWNKVGTDIQYAGLETSFQWVEEILKKEIEGFTRLPKKEKDQLILRKKQELWDLTLKRNPLAVWRGLVVAYPELEDELSQKLWGKKLTEETRPEFYKEINEIEDWLLILKERAVKNLEKDLNYELIPDDKMREKVKRYVESIRGIVWEKGFLGGRQEDLKNPRRRVAAVGLLDEGENGDFKKIFPYVVTTSDIPFEKLKMDETGQIGFLDRRWRDVAAADGAKNEVLGLISEVPRLAKEEDYLQKLHRILLAYDGYAGRKTAQDVIAYLAEMFCRANQKLPLDKLLPAGLGNLFGLIERPRSYTQIIFGPEGAVWDAINIRRFIQGLAKRDLISSLGEHNHEEKLFDKLKVKTGHVFLEFLLRWGPWGIVGFFTEIVNNLLKDIKEELKKATA